MHCRHRTPFGSEVQEDHGVRFSPWAPTARRAGPCLDAPEGERVLRMNAAGDGWLKPVTAKAGPGSLYGYPIDGGHWVSDAGWESTFGRGVRRGPEGRALGCDTACPSQPRHLRPFSR